jgi:hypothetical protein
VTRSLSSRTSFPLATITTAAAVSALALLAAGCGSGGSPGATNGTSSTTAATTTAQNGTTTVQIGSFAGALAFARCMRSHGIPNWPDPTSDGGFDKSKLQQLGLSVSRVRAIEDSSCRYDFVNSGGGARSAAQQGGTQLVDELSFARCMRSHGVTRFPDPTAQGGLTIEMVEAQGIDLHSPAVLRVVQACLPASHGALTPAMVRQALNSAGR